MRNILNEIKNLIINVFLKENILVIIIFGSYGIDKYILESDIDIVWIFIKKVLIIEFVIKIEVLRNILDIDVDLKIVIDNYIIVFKKVILEGEVIYEFKDFKDYINKFYFENSDVIDILDWRDMYGN